MENVQDASEVDVHVTSSSPLVQNTYAEDIIADDDAVMPSSSVISNNDGKEGEVALPLSKKVDEKSSYLDVSSAQQLHDPAMAIQALTTWQHLNKTMRSELLHEGKSDTWREEWFGVHLPPSAVVIGSPTLEIMEETTTTVQESLALDSGEGGEVNEEEDNLITEQVSDTEEVETEKEEAPVQVQVEEPPPAKVQHDNVPILPPQPIITLKTLLNNPGPSIPLYPLILLLLALYTIKQVLNCVFGFKSRTRVSRSVNRVLLKRKQFVIPKDQLLQHIEWMRLRNDLRRTKEKNSRTMEEVVKDEDGGSLDEDDEDGGRRNGGGGGDGMNGSSSDNGSSSSGGRHHDDSTNDNGGNEKNGNYDGNDNSHNYSNHHSSHLDFDDDKENINPTMERKVLFSMEEDEQSISGAVCNYLEKTSLHSMRFEDLSKKDDTTEEETSQESIPNYLEEVPAGDLEQLKADNISATEKILILKKMIAKLMEKKDGEIALLRSQVELSEQAVKESSEKATAYEKQCKDMLEEIASLKEDVAVLELVCERMYSSGEGEDDLEGLEIEGASCLLVSQLDSLTNVDENEDDLTASTDTEWERMVDENQLLRSENELLQESMTCLRKELKEARSEAEILTQEMKYVKFLKVLSPIKSDETMEMTDESFECAGNNNNSIPLLVDGTISKANAQQSPPPRSREVTNAIQLILKHAQSTKEVPKENENPNHDLNKDLLQLMANLRRLGIDQRVESERPSSPRKKRSTKGRESPGKGSIRRRSAKERLKILAKSRFRRFKSLKSS